MGKMLRRVREHKEAKRANPEMKCLHQDPPASGGLVGESSGSPPLASDGSRKRDAVLAEKSVRTEEHPGISDNRLADEILLRTGALGVLSDLLLRTRSSLPANNPFPKDDPRYKRWVGIVGEIAKHHSNLAEKLPAENADPRQYDGWVLDCLKAFFIGSAIETAISLPNRDPESLAAYYDYLDTLSEVVCEIGQQLAPHLTPSFFAGLPSRITKWREAAKAAMVAPRVAPHGFDGVRDDLQQVLHESLASTPAEETPRTADQSEFETGQRAQADAFVDTVALRQLPEASEVRSVADVAKAISSWQEIEIRFLSEERVQITAGNERKTLNYAEFGFEDGRSGKPNLAWIMLRSLAELGGTIHHANGGKGWAIVEKRMQEVRKVLRKHFRLNDDPLPFVESVGYRARFKISLAESYKA